MKTIIDSLIFFLMFPCIFLCEIIPGVFSIPSISVSLEKKWNWTEERIYNLYTIVGGIIWCLTFLI